MNSIFSEQILADKLNKLNSTQQCIETLSHWCIFHRQKAEQVVQTWDKQFHSSDQEHKIPFLYLANDILQNSRRRGTEFVEEFWKVLPKALKDVVGNGDDRGKTVVSRLVEIWEERRVFGSRARGLKDLMLGNEPAPTLELTNGSNKKRLRSVRILRRDSRSIRIKLSIGGTAEKIVSAFHAVLSDHPMEDVDLKKCQEAVHRVGKMEKDVDAACSLPDDPQRAILADNLQQEGTVLKECLDNLKSVESSREALVSALKEALREQESQLENVRTQLQVAQAQIEEAANMRRRLNNEPVIATTNSSGVNSREGTKKTAAAIAAEVADKLAASTHSQQIMTSVLSTFAAEEAKNAAGLTPSQPAPVASNPSKKRVNFENSVQLQPVAVTTTQQYQTVLVPQPSVQSTPSTSTQQYQTVLVPQPSVQNSPSTSTPQFAIVHTSPAQHYMQPTGGQLMIGYAYNSQPSQLPPPPPQQMMSMARPPPQLAQPQQQPQTIGLIPSPQLQMPMTLQQPMPVNQHVPMNMQPVAPPNYRPLQPPGMNFFHQQSH